MLPTNFKDDVLDTTKNTSRIYNIKSKSGSTIQSEVLLEDVTEYSQQGSQFSASQINATNTEVNTLSNNLSAYDMDTQTSTDTKFRFGTSGGKYGYIAKVEGADTFFPFSSKNSYFNVINIPSGTTKQIDFGFEPDVIVTFSANSLNISSSEYAMCYYNKSENATKYKRLTDNGKSLTTIGAVQPFNKINGTIFTYAPGGAFAGNVTIIAVKND